MLWILAAAWLGYASPKVIFSFKCYRRANAHCARDFPTALQESTSSALLPNAWTDFLQLLSYSLIHLPVLLATLSLVYPMLRSPIAAIGIAPVAGYASVEVMNRWIEVPTQNLGRTVWLWLRDGRKSPAPTISYRSKSSEDQAF
jgi:hypothetical protein